jgi:hypothetical protein
LSFEYDIPDRGSTLDQAREIAGMEEVASMWLGGLGEDPAEWLRQHGWTVESISRATFVQRYGRSLLDSAGGFVTAIRR